MRYIRLTPENELFVWLGCASVSLSLLFCFRHTFYVTAFTFWCGIPIIGLTAFLFWMRFRPRVAQSHKVPRVVATAILVLLTFIVLLYLLGVATYYE